ncbi:hypothetical protein [Paenibacillus spongiae]|uniref:HPP family protein n=1 Tax=Paenibacillus spongiae TaxID=2909671 RepID=A0ABY5S4K0_9BACL|nr:hypothetical protein [Paenibacillus spongiae]UVI28418.1 hypothetical protein L1F29_23605 [Paenibacillus spongiae]
MKSSLSKKETMISYFIAITFIVGMTTASVLFKDNEIILPEIAAMAIAMWAYREAGWIRRPSMITIAPTLTALSGFLINQLPIAYIGKVLLALIIMMLILRILRSNLAPSIATGLLPLVINTSHWSFVLIVLILTLILMLGVVAFSLNKGLERTVKIPYKYMLVFLALTFIWVGVCWLAGYPQFSVIPPILVVVYESLHKPMYNGKMAFKQGLVLTLSATIGTLLYFSMDSWILITLLDMLLMLGLSLLVGIRIPAIYAFPLLPFIFPEEIARNLPLGSLVTCLFLFTSVLLYKKYERKQMGMNMGSM